jgi:hypothetical protein
MRHTSKLFMQEDHSFKATCLVLGQNMLIFLRVCEKIFQCGVVA